MAKAKRYWLLKSEPECYSVDHLARESTQTTYWDGVRNYQARNFLRDDLQVGDLAFFYHSNADPPAIAGVVQVVQAGYPDHTAWNPQSDHYDPQSTPDNPRWFMVDVQLVDRFPTPLSLDQLRTVPALADMELLRRGSRLSVQPVRASEYRAIMKLRGKG